MDFMNPFNHILSLICFFGFSLNITSRLYLFTLQQGGQTVSLNYGKRINEGPHQSMNRPSKMMKVEDRRTTSLPGGHASNSMLPKQVQAPQVISITSF